MLGQILGNYRVVEQLGEGGMGVVYVGRHEALGHRVVVKVLRPEMSRNRDMVRRFFNEAQAATAIRNPGIVQVFDFGHAPDGSAYFVMELLEGVDLGQRLKQRKLDAVECCRLTRQVANVLQSAHDAGITHRDLKPDNLFLVPDPEVIGGERVKVLDFGIAKLAGAIHAAGVQTSADLVMGTPSYMSPEQCRGAGSVDTRSDIYSLGCVLFRMVSGRAPFIGHGAGDIIGAHLHAPVPDLLHYAPEAPPGLAQLVGRMLEKKPDARPQRMAEVSQALDEILRTLVEPTGRPSMPQIGQPSAPHRYDARPLPGMPPPAPPLPGMPPAMPPPGMAPEMAPYRPSQATTTPASSLATTLPVSGPAPEHAPAPANPLLGSALASPLPPAAGPPSYASPLPPAAGPVSLASPLPPAAGPPSYASPLPLTAGPPSYASSYPPPGGAPLYPHAPTAQSGPQLSSTSTTLGGAAGMSSNAQPRAGVRRLPWLLGGLAVIGVVTIIAVVAAGSDGSTERQIAFSDIAAAAPPTPGSAESQQGGGPAQGTNSAAGSAAAAAAGSAAAAPAASPAAAPAASPAAAPADDLESECRGLQVDHKWAEVEQCAAKLKATDPRRAEELQTRAVEEEKTAPHIAAVEAALRDRNLRKARDELGQVWTESLDYKKINDKYEAAVRQAPKDLAARLERATTPDCAAYNEILAKERPLQLTATVTEATQKSPCTPIARGQCDVKALVKEAEALHAAGKLTAAFATYDKAWFCKSDPQVAKKGFVVACLMSSVQKAKLFWTRLPADAKRSMAVYCKNNEITEQQLDAP